MSAVVVVAPHLRDSSLRARLWKSHGTCDAAESTTSLPFEPGARSARGSWSPMEESSTRVRLDRVARHAANTVGLVQLPAELVHDVRTLDQLRRAAGQDPETDRQLSSMIERLLVALRDAGGWTLRGDVLGAGFTRKPGGLTNTTMNTKTGCYVGLHFDSWDRLPTTERHLGQNRVCLNLGPGPRGLQFAPLTAMEMDARLDALPPADAETSARRRGDLARGFLRQFPNEPVFRIAIMPGEAYIAPTENLVHDGWTGDTAGPDVSLSIRGHFEPLADFAQV